jgi:putative endonuclease
VKTRETADYGPPERAVSAEKQRHLIRVGREYARKTNVPWERVRFDVVSIVLQDQPTIILLRGAF